jgi:hypothetical protein
MFLVRLLSVGCACNFFKIFLSGPLKQFFEYVVKLKYETKPDYKLCRGFFEKGLKAISWPIGKLQFTSSSASPQKVPLCLSFFGSLFLVMNIQ